MNYICNHWNVENRKHNVRARAFKEDGSTKSLLVDDPTIEPLPATDKKVGIDVGISSLITTSDGEKITNPKHFNRLYQKLRVAQKELSRKTKGSNNRDKAQLKVAKIHAQIKDARTDCLGARSR